MRITLILLILFLPNIVASEVLDRVVAVVNSDIITLSELEGAFQPYAGQIRSENYPLVKEQAIIKQAKKDMLEHLIEKKIEEGLISEKDIHVPDEDVDKTMYRVREQNGHTEEELVQLLKKDGITLNQYKDQLREQILHARLVNQEVRAKIVITEGEIREYYDKHREQYQGEERFHIALIYIKASDKKDMTEVLEEGRKIAKEIATGLLFDEAARLYSEAAGSEKGGDLGSFSLDELVPSLQEAVKRLKPGEISPVISTEDGAQIVKLIEKEGKSAKYFEQAKEEIHQELFQKKVEEEYTAWLAGLKKKAYIKMLLGY
ncbi:MAG: peptidyl-prolyl cis-trans isomerase [Pseudomonadota bacterium]